MDTHGMSEVERQMLHKSAPHSLSFYNFNGEHMQPSFGKENLLDLLMKRERFVCDSNSAWKDEAGNIGNKSKAFVIGHTVLDESEDVHGNLFGKKVKFTNENIFFFTIVPYQGVTGCLAIERYDVQFLKRFDPDALKRVSRDRVQKSDVKYLESERQLMDQVRSEKENMLSFLEMTDIAHLPPIEATERQKAGIVEYVRSIGPKCCGDFRLSMNIAGLCYTALLLERDEVGKKTRNEFSDVNRRNVLGDVLLFRDALWLRARILSNDAAVRRMAEYIGIPEMRVSGMA
jgi:hypothetical protein